MNIIHDHFKEYYIRIYDVINFPVDARLQSTKRFQQGTPPDIPPPSEEHVLYVAYADVTVRLDDAGLLLLLCRPMQQTVTLCKGMTKVTAKADERVQLSIPETFEGQIKGELQVRFSVCVFCVGPKVCRLFLSLPVPTFFSPVFPCLIYHSVCFSVFPSVSPCLVGSLPVSLLCSQSLSVVSATPFLCFSLKLSVSSRLSFFSVSPCLVCHFVSQFFLSVSPCLASHPVSLFSPSICPCLVRHTVSLFFSQTLRVWSATSSLCFFFLLFLSLSVSDLSLCLFFSQSLRV